jgi:hypothetical protein
MLKQPASSVLTSFRPSSYPEGTPAGLHSLRPCWTGCLSILPEDVRGKRCGRIEKVELYKHTVKQGDRFIDALATEILNRVFPSLSSHAKREYLLLNGSTSRSDVRTSRNSTMVPFGCGCVPQSTLTPPGHNSPPSDHSTRAIPIGALNIDLYGQIPLFRGGHPHEGVSVEVSQA